MSEPVIENLLDGAALSCLMTPDDAIEEYQPLHDENMSLPHAIICDDVMWGVSLNGYFTPGAPGGNYLYFSNYKDIYGVFSPDAALQDLPSTCRLSTLKRFKRFAFATKNNFRLIWDSEGEQDFDAIRRAVHEAIPLRIALLDEENIWNLHPVIMPQVEQNSENFILQTHTLVYPAFFRNQGILDVSWDTIAPYLNDPAIYRDQGYMAFKIGFFIGCYHIRGDGSYKSAYDMVRGNTTNTYRRLKIFAEGSVAGKEVA